MLTRPIHRLLSGLLLAALPALASTAHAADYPTRVVKLVVPVAAGGPNDILARTLAPRLAASLGQQVIVEAMPGAGGNLATAALLRQPHDGYQLLLHGMAYAVNPSIYGTASPYAVPDYTTVSVIGKGPLILVAHPSAGVKTVADLVALAKGRAEPLPYASGGIGTSPHLAAELFKSMAGVNLLHVPYKGTSAFMPDLLAGRIPVAFVSPLVVRPFVQGGQLLALGVTSSRPSKGWDIPTIAQAGVAGYDFDAWYAIFSPAKTPADVVARLNKAINDASLAPDVQEKWASMGVEPVRGSAAEAQEYVNVEFAKWARVVKSANIKPE